MASHKRSLEVSVEESSKKFKSVGENPVFTVDGNIRVVLDGKHYACYSEDIDEKDRRLIPVQEVFVHYESIKKTTGTLLVELQDFYYMTRPRVCVVCGKTGNLSLLHELEIYKLWKWGCCSGVELIPFLHYVHVWCVCVPNTYPPLKTIMFCADHGGITCEHPKLAVSKCQICLDSTIITYCDICTPQARCEVCVVNHCPKCPKIEKKEPEMSVEEKLKQAMDTEASLRASNYLEITQLKTCLAKTQQDLENSVVNCTVLKDSHIKYWELELELKQSESALLKQSEKVRRLEEEHKLEMDSARQKMDVLTQELEGVKTEANAHHQKCAEEVASKHNKLQLLVDAAYDERDSALTQLKDKNVELESIKREREKLLMKKDAAEQRLEQEKQENQQHWCITKKLQEQLTQANKQSEETKKNADQLELKLRTVNKKLSDLEQQNAINSPTERAMLILRTMPPLAKRKMELQEDGEWRCMHCGHSTQSKNPSHFQLELKRPGNGFTGDKCVKILLRDEKRKQIRSIKMEDEAELVALRAKRDALKQAKADREKNKMKNADQLKSQMEEKSASSQVKKEPMSSDEDEEEDDNASEEEVDAEQPKAMSSQVKKEPMSSDEKEVFDPNEFE